MRKYVQITGGLRGTRRPYPVHLLNNATRRSFCQFENNSDPQWRPRKFDKLPAESFGYPVLVCKNCEKLASQQSIKAGVENG